MTYYEELGISETASREEIRQAYKQLARLIHPDHCGDNPTRRLADLQLKRLNGILEMLLDPQGRADYDRSLMALAAAVAGEPLPEIARPWDARWAAPGAIAAAAALLILLVVLSAPKPPASSPAVPEITEAAPDKTPPRARRVSARPLPSPVSPQQAEWEPLVSYAYESHIAIPPLPFDVPAPRPQPATAPSKSALAGDWFFVPARASDSSGYPPEYIELRLRQQGGLLHGRYQARYRVADRAISPNVAFQFEGREGGTMRWHGTSGANGEVNLRLLPDGELEVKWQADQLGREMGLVSGSARLVRKLE